MFKWLLTIVTKIQFGFEFKHWYRQTLIKRWIALYTFHYHHSQGTHFIDRASSFFLMPTTTISPTQNCNDDDCNSILNRPVTEFWSNWKYDHHGCYVHPVTLQTISVPYIYAKTWVCLFSFLVAKIQWSTLPQDSIISFIDHLMFLNYLNVVKTPYKLRLKNSLGYYTKGSNSSMSPCVYFNSDCNKSKLDIKQKGGIISDNYFDREQCTAINMASKLILFVTLLNCLIYKTSGREYNGVTA